MRIASLGISDLRVIRELSLIPSPLLNFVVGPNGAGKTSVLESVYLGGRGRTFRHPDAGPLIRYGASAARTVIGLKRPGRGGVSTLGVERTKNGIACRLDGEIVRKRSVLAETLPVVWISSQPQLLLNQGPDARRRFLDMVLFHVEPESLNHLAAFSRILRQRNAALRSGDGVSAANWDYQFIEKADLIAVARSALIDHFSARTNALLSQWGWTIEVQFAFRRGWRRDGDLGDLLKQRLRGDLRQGFTSVGPQRADVEFRVAAGPANKTLSRGQQKMLVMALNLAAVDLTREQRADHAPVVLIDDLAAELDAENRSRVIRELECRSLQAFLTKIDPTAIASTTAKDQKTFHVEHGALQAID